MEVLVTNDDGYDSPGLHALARALSEVASVVIVAPADDQSEIGRRRSTSVTIQEKRDGFAVNGTPADCVIVALEALDLTPDLVVSGCNIGANVGAYSFGRSGTISAAVEAAFFDIPSIAISLYVPDGQWPIDAVPEHFTEAERVIQFLTERYARIIPDGGYLNVNVPIPGDTPAAPRMTRPSERHAVGIDQHPDRIDIIDETWRQMAAGEWEEAIETDRGAVMQGWISVSPLVAPHQVATVPALSDAVTEYVDYH